MLAFAARLADICCSQNDEELERTLNELQVITKAETARAEKAAEELRRERALASAALLRESDAELERRLSSPAASMQSSPRHEAPETAWVWESTPFEAAEQSQEGSSGAAEAAVVALTSKLIEQRRARALASATRIAQLAHQRKYAKQHAALRYSSDAPVSATQ